MTADLASFCTDTRQALQSLPLDQALARVAQALAALLRDPAFVAATFDETMPAGKRELYRDAATDFRVLAHVQPAGKGGAAHDHGPSWAVYGNARGRTDMTEYRRANAAGDTHAVLQPQPPYSLHAGQARAFAPGTIHATAHPELAWVLRITGTDLDAAPRYRFRKGLDEVLQAT
jgi:hypothetical protein